MSHTKSAAVLGESLPPTDTDTAAAVAVAAPEATCLVAILILGFVLLGVSGIIIPGVARAREHVKVLVLVRGEGQGRRT